MNRTVLLWLLVFQSGGDGWPASQIDGFVSQWTSLNYVRTTIGGIGWLCPLRALSLSGRAASPSTADMMVR